MELRRIGFWAEQEELGEHEASDALWRRWCTEHTAPRPEADALSLQAARELMRELATPSFSLDVKEANGRWAIEFSLLREKT